MAGLDAIRNASRAAIHAQFTVTAVVRSPDGSVEIPGISIRLHRDVKKPFGDLDREGFTFVIEQHSEAIFDTWQWEPQRGWTVDCGGQRVFIVGEAINDRAERYRKYGITPKRS